MASRAILTRSQAQNLDRFLIRSKRIEAFELMRRAGEGAFDRLMLYWPQCSRIAVLCGSGNNGGDGYVLAAAALRQQIHVDLYQAAEPRSPESRRALQVYLELGGKTANTSELTDLARYDVVVDALLGIGLSRDVRSELALLIQKINEQDMPVLALDIPSGLDADTGHVRGIAVEANVTVTFICHKMGTLTGRAADYVGQLELETLDTDEFTQAEHPSAPQLVEPSELAAGFPHRNPDAHKVSVGQVLIVGGAKTMQGAAQMAALAAYRTGAGLVSIAAAEESGSFRIQISPEIRLFEISDADALQPLLDRAGAVGIGPGLGQDGWARQIWETVSKLDRKLVVDADALNLLAENPVRRQDWALTPHPGEAARLLGVSTKEIQGNRLEAAVQITKKYGGVCVLKGTGTLIVSKRQSWLCSRGNPGMATGGMGDVLTGVICALLGQGMGLDEAARTGVWLHAAAGDRAAQNSGMLGTMAMDLMPHLRLLLNGLHPETKGLRQRLPLVRQRGFCDAF